MKRLAGIGLLALAVLFCGCTTAKSLTLLTDSGDLVKLTLDTTDGHDWAYRDNVLTIGFRDTKVMEGVLLSGDGYERFVERLKEEYEFTHETTPFSLDWMVRDGEVTLLFPIDPGRVGMIVSSRAEGQAVRTVLEKLSFSAKEKE